LISKDALGDYDRKIGAIYRERLLSLKAKHPSFTALFGSPAISHLERPVALRHPPHDRVALLAALLREDAPALL